jgi:hypothetical protein
VPKYSSIAIAAPLLLVHLPNADQQKTSHGARIENISAAQPKVKSK